MGRSMEPGSRQSTGTADRSRRQFLKTVTAGSAIGGLTGMIGNVPDSSAQGQTETTTAGIVDTSGTETADSYTQVHIWPTQGVVAPGKSVTADIILEPPRGSGMCRGSEYEVTVDIEDPTVAEITDIKPPGYLVGESTIDDGQRATLTVYQEPWYSYIGPKPPIATVTLDGKTAGSQAEIAAEVSLLGDGCIIRSARKTVSVEHTEPEPPSNLECTQVAAGTLELSWTHPSDPCDSNVDHYVVSVDGSDEKTVPAGVTATSITPEPTSPAEIGVRAVDSSTGESAPTMTEASWTQADPVCRIEPDLPAEVLAADELMTVPIEWRDLEGSFPALESVTVDVSPACPIDVSGSTLADGVEGSTDIDGSSVTVTVDDLPADPDATGTLATVELSGFQPGHTRIAVGDVSTASDSVIATDGAVLEVDFDISEYIDSVPGIAGTPPTDPDDDGRFEDLNGNGYVDFTDVNVLFRNTDAPIVTNHATYFDFTDDGEISLQDVLALFDMV